MWSIKLIINEQNKSKSIDIENRVAVDCMMIDKNETWW